MKVKADYPNRNVEVAVGWSRLDDRCVYVALNDPDGYGVAHLTPSRARELRAILKVAIKRAERSTA